MFSSNQRYARRQGEMKSQSQSQMANSKWYIAGRLVTNVERQPRESQCGRSVAQARTVAERPIDLAIHRQSKCLRDALARSRLSYSSLPSFLRCINRDRGHRAALHGTNPGTTHRCFRAYHAVPMGWLGSFLLLQRDQAMAPCPPRCTVLL